MAGAGAPRGLPGERPPSGGGWRTGTASTGTGSTSGPGDVVQHRRRPRTAGPRPGPRASPPRGIVGAAGQVRTGQRPGDSEVPHRVPGGPVLPGGGPGAGPAAPHDVCASLEGPRAAQGRVGGGRGENRRASKSVGGRECTVGESQVAARIGLRLATCSGTESSVTVTRGRGRPVSACSGMERRTASSGWLPWSRELHSVRRGLAPISEAGRENRGPGSTAGHRVPGPGRLPHRTPGPAGASRWPGSVQGVHAVLRRGRPLLHGGPAASTAVRSTPDRGDAAPQRGKTPRARSWGERSWGCWASPAAPRGGRPAAWGPAAAERPRRGAGRPARRPRGRSRR